MRLGSNIKKGQMIKTAYGWRKIREVTATGVLVKEGEVGFGHPIYGWKIK